MALIKCKECGNEVSSKAAVCPKCGAKVAAKPMGFGTLIGVLFLAGIILSTFSVLFSKITETDSSLRTTTPQLKPTASPVPKIPGEQWIYQQAGDPMGKGIAYHAKVFSSNIVKFGFPYSGAQRGTLMLRSHPRHGTDVIFSIERGQIMCHSYQDCAVLVRFDDGPSSKFSAVGPVDNSTEMIFIRNYHRFVEKLRKSKTVRIAVDIYQEGSPVFEFDVTAFDPDKYRPKK